MNKQQQLDDIRAQILADKICPELAKTAKHLVFGEGSPDAEVVFIGEAPGKNEDLTGRPFIGAAGRFLDELLKSIGLKRADVYITSILKYRPPDNRDPKPAEKTAFWPYLLAQLEVIKPKLVVALGRHSANCFLPDLQISKAHGQVQEAGQWRILPLYHPAAALYNGSMKNILMTDFAQIRTIINKNIT